ncbi:MAG: hypothetical protein E6Q89_09205 [Bacteroidia bacterium]|nr:MAG: hypothetical protein E6Q89_09205 [Bacteroidia bacterium]
MKNNHIFFGLLLISLFACKPKEQSFEQSLGDVDASRFVAVGGSITAGELDGAMSYEGQKLSLGAILAEQFAGNSFTQPYFSESSVGINPDGLSSLVLGYKTDCLGVTSLSPVRKAPSGDQAALSTNVYTSPFANMGVPLLKSTEMTQLAYPSMNSFFARMASNPNVSYLDDVMLNNPTFFSYFIGLDDILAYAKKGAKGTMIPANGLDGVGFSGSVSTSLNVLTSNGAKGVVANIPDVTEMPYFTTIPYNGLNLDAEKVATLNSIYNPIGFSFQEGPNAFMIEDPSQPFGVRPMVEGELILLSVPLDSVKCYKMGSVFPFRNEFVLTLDEIQTIRTQIDAYNSILTNEAANRNLALVDTKTFYHNFVYGIYYNGIKLTNKLVSGGAYSLDGISLNPKTTALLANEFIKAINNHYHATIKWVDASKYRGVVFP